MIGGLGWAGFFGKTRPVDQGVATPSVASAEQQWKQVAVVSKVQVYPVKSGRRHDVDAADCTAMGLRVGRLMDRQLMAVKRLSDGSFSFVTARQQSRLVLIRCDVADSGVVTLSAPGCPSNCSFSLSTVLERRHVIQSKMFRPPATHAGLDCGDEVGGWLSALLVLPNIRLVMWQEGVTSRTLLQLDAKLTQNFGHSRDDPTSFADFSPLMLMSEASLAAHNLESGKNLDMNRFRPNVTVKECAPYAESHWNKIKIGDDVELTCLKLATRCTVTNVDPETAQVDKTVLESLEKFRRPTDEDDWSRYEGKPVLGVKLAVDCIGRIKVGDPVFAQMSP